MKNKKLKDVEKFLWKLGMNEVKAHHRKTKTDFDVVSCLFIAVDLKFREEWVKRKLSDEFGKEFIDNLIGKINCVDLEGN